MGAEGFTPPSLALRYGVQALRHVHFVRAFVEALPCLAEQPTFVGRVLEVSTFLLALGDEIHLVVRQAHEVHRTLLSRLAYHLEPQTMLDLLYRSRRSTISVYGSVPTVAPLAIVVTGAVLLRDLARYVMNRVFENNFSHFD